MFEGAIRLVREITAVVFQPTCLRCGSLSRAAPFCSNCCLFFPVTGPWCEQCGVTVSEKIQKCGECQGWDGFSLGKLRTSFWLSDTAKAFLHQVKYRGAFELFSWMKLDSSEFTFLLDEQMSLVPVPMYFNKLRMRSFNQSEILAKLIAKKNNLPLAVDILEKIRATESQTFLSKKTRSKNLRRAFQVRRGHSLPNQICLIDDTYTTGATLKECAQVLRKKGVEKVYGWTLFRTPSPRLGVLESARPI